MYKANMIQNTVRNSLPDTGLYCNYPNVLVGNRYNSVDYNTQDIFINEIKAPDQFDIIL